MQLLQSKKFPCEYVNLFGFCNKGKRTATAWFAVLKPGCFSWLKPSNVFLMFYLLHFWIWFNVKLCVSYEAVTWKLCLRHLLCPTALTLLAKAASPCRVVSPWVEVGDAFSVPQLHLALFAAHQNIATSRLCSVQCHVHTCCTEKLRIIWSLKKSAKGPSLAERLKLGHYTRLGNFPLL